MSEFRSGDRVRHGSGWEGVIVGPTASGMAVVVERDDLDVPTHDRLVIINPGALTVVPDMVTVTVELPADEATAVAEFYTPAAYAAEEWARLGQLPTAAFHRLGDAAREALS